MTGTNVIVSNLYENNAVTFIEFSQFHYGVMWWLFFVVVFYPQILHNYTAYVRLLNNHKPFPFKI